jgi:hypothetical protein
MAGALIAKAILGAIGGGFEGAAKPYSSGNSGVKAKDTGADKVGKEEEKKEIDKETKEVIDNVQKAESTGQVKAKYNQPFNVSNMSNIKSGLNLDSDARLKEIYGDSISDRIIEDFAKIAAIDFKYTPEAQSEYKGENGVDDKEHTGVIAQDLASTESTESAVEKDENGNLSVDTRQLTMANTAAISELSRRILTVETALKELMSRKG